LKEFLNEVETDKDLYKREKYLNLFYKQLEANREMLKQRSTSNNLKVLKNKY
jgi:hypothetical protein